jgi:hypothetical protein
MRLSDFATVTTGTRFRVKRDLNCGECGLVTRGSLVEFVAMAPHWLDAQDGGLVPARSEVPMFRLVVQGDADHECDPVSEWDPTHLMPPHERFCCYARDVEREVG